MPGKRIILETNIWISFLISSNHSKLDSLLESGEFILLFSNESMEEFLEVTRRPKFKRFFSKKDVTKLLETIDAFAELILIESDVSLCRDEKDNFLLNLAIDGKADYLITGDHDLLALNKVKTTRILTFSKFIEMTE